jgi:hypothetical protein
VGPALVLEHRVQPSRISTPKLPVLFSARNSPTPGLVSLMGLPTPPTFTLRVAVFRALCLNPGTDAESSKQVPLKEKVTTSTPYSMDRYMLEFRSDTVAVTLKEMVELDAESVGASTNCSTAASAVALGGNTMPKGEHQDGDEARVFLDPNRRGKTRIASGCASGGRVYASDDRGPLWRIGRSRSLEGRTRQRQPTP